MADNLSGASAFWAIVTIALNTMAQPTGKTLGFPTKYNFILRCSPIICGVHAIDTLVQATQVCLEAYKKRASIRHAFGVWTWSRFEGAGPGGSLKFVRKGNKLVLLSFALGALLQAIKLFACENVLTTKIICGLYLGAFLVDELIILVAPNAEAIDSSANESPAADLSTREIVLLSVFNTPIPPLTIIFALGQASTIQGGVVSVVMAISIFPLIIVGSYTFDSQLYTHRWPEVRRAFLVILCCIMSCLTAATLTITWGRAAQVQEPSFMLVIAPSFAHALLTHSIRFEMEGQDVGWRRVFYTSFLMEHVAGGMVGYWGLYDPVTTYKPQWTNDLG
jgi:hypothetical protein